jgi:hypothetical protein
VAEIEAEFLVRENNLMTAWMHRDEASIKSLVSRDSVFLFGALPPVLLDRRSFIGALDGGFVCTAFRFHETTARQYGKSTWFSGHAELELKIRGRDWSGHFMITDLWRKGRFRRRWQLAERSLAPLKGDGSFSSAIRSLQLWR